MRRIFLVRHGESTSNRDRIVSGWSDYPLTKIGEEQSRAVAYRLKEILDGTFVLVSSDLLIEKQTTEIISQVLDIEPVYSEQLRTLNTGKATGLPATEAGKYLVYEAQYDTNIVLFQDGESYNHLYQRVSKYLKSIDPNMDLIIVCSWETIQMTIHWWLENPAEHRLRYTHIHNHGSITSLKENPDRKQIQYINNTSHLPIKEQ